MTKRFLLYIIYLMCLLVLGYSCSTRKSLNDDVIERFQVYFLEKHLMTNQDMIVIYYPPSSCEPCLKATNNLIHYLEKESEDDIFKVLVSYPTNEGSLYKPEDILYYSANYREFERNGINLSGAFVFLISEHNFIYVKTINDINLELIKKRINRFIH